MANIVIVKKSLVSIYFLPDHVWAAGNVPRCSVARSEWAGAGRGEGSAVSVSQSYSVCAEMAADLVREESFRTALRNQKRRLSATEKKPSAAEVAALAGGVSRTLLGARRDSLTPPRRDLLTPPRTSFTPPR